MTLPIKLPEPDNGWSSLFNVVKSRGSRISSL